MDKDPKSGSMPLSGNGIIAVVLLAAGAFFVHEAPLETTRLPAADQRLEQPPAPQDVDARLWQDPFGAVAKAQGDLKKTAGALPKEEYERRAHTALAGEIAGKQTQVQVLAVMLASGPYAENVEGRRRGRYAVLAGLNASRLAPVDTEHLGYVYLPPDPEKPGAARAVVAFEWLQPIPDGVSTEREVKGIQAPVLVLWLQSESYAVAPLKRLAALVDLFPRTTSWRVLGPNGSDGLQAMVDEAGKENPDYALPAGRVRFYSLYATVSAAALLPGTKESDKDALHRFFARKGVDFVRTIGDDASLADAMIRELGLRGLDPEKVEPARYNAACRDAPVPGSSAPRPSHVALIAEWDTLYGRSLQREFRAIEDQPGFCVNRFSYVRGLDGQLLGSGDGASSSGGGSTKPAASDKDAARRKDGTFVERAEGMSQFDYLRRLAVQMRAQDQRVRETSDPRGFLAIGVLGNDLHDKLLVLQALQPEFPNAIFFTTDMDARYLHPREQAWTRNLLVASTFGLRLDQSFQQGAPPFRDGYQSAAFFATRLAMDDARRARSDGADAAPLPQSKIDEWLAVPRIFEIGRTAGFDFAGREAAKPGTGSSISKCWRGEWMACTDIHPPGSRRYPAPGMAVMTLIFAGIVFLLWAPLIPLSRGLRGCLKAAFSKAEGPQRPGEGQAVPPVYGRLLIAMALILQVVLPLVLAWQWPAIGDALTRDGKPLLAIEGISLWPTEGIRLFTLGLCVFLLLRAWLRLSYNLDDIAIAFASNTVRREQMQRRREADKHMRRWQRFAQMFSTRFTTRRSADGLDFWDPHIVQDRIGARLARTVACVAVAVIVSYLLTLAWAEVRFVPIRGELSSNAHEVLRIPALAMMYVLVFFVVDATVLCVRFVDGLRGLRPGDEREAHWPPSTRALFERELGMGKAYVDGWIDLRFIAMRTRCVTGLIYYPFIVISLWILSRNAAFDHWPMSVGTLIPAVVGAAVALACALLLRRAAEASREAVLERVRNAVMHANVAKEKLRPDEPSARQLELLQARIERLHEGAFAPFWQQPLLKAVLLPFATLGGTTLLDYLALANI